jgi:hypothetical protein
MTWKNAIGQLKTVTDYQEVVCSLTWHKANGVKKNIENFSWGAERGERETDFSLRMVVKAQRWSFE